MSLQAHFEIKNLLRRMEIGCAPDEHGVTQEVALTLRVTLHGDDLFGGETFQPGYDYTAMIDAVDAAIASRPRFVLQETLFVAIAARVLAHPLVQRLDMEMAKTERYSGCDAIGMAAALTRDDLRAIAARYAEDPALAEFLDTTSAVVES